MVLTVVNNFQKVTAGRAVGLKLTVFTVICDTTGRSCGPYAGRPTFDIGRSDLRLFCRRTRDMQMLGPHIPHESDAHLPLAFPLARWLSFDLEERSRFNRAQLVLDAMEVTAPRTVGALARDTGL